MLSVERCTCGGGSYGGYYVGCFFSKIKFKLLKKTFMIFVTLLEKNPLATRTRAQGRKVAF